MSCVVAFHPENLSFFVLEGHSITLLLAPFMDAASIWYVAIQIKSTMNHTAMESALQALLEGDSDSALFAFTTVLAKAVANNQTQQDDLFHSAIASNIHNNADDDLRSILMAILCIPFGCYFGLVFVIFVVECYQFLAVWNLVSQSRYNQNAFFWRRPFRNNNRSLEAVEDTFDTRPSQKMSVEDTRKRRQQIEAQLETTQYKESCDGGSSCQEPVIATTNCCCPICLVDFEALEEIASIRECHCAVKHPPQLTGKRSNNSSSSAPRQQQSSLQVYHKECLLQWLDEKPSCPYCRYEVHTTEEDEKQQQQQQQQQVQQQQQQQQTRSVTASLERASLEMEHCLFRAVSYFGECLLEYTY